MHPVGVGERDRPGNGKLAAPRVAPDRSPERYRRKLQAPAAAPDRNTGTEGGTGEFDLSRNGGRPIINVERRAGDHYAIEIRQGGAERKGLPVGDVQGCAANIRSMQAKGSDAERKVRLEAEIPASGLPSGRRPLGNQYVRHQIPIDCGQYILSGFVSMCGHSAKLPAPGETDTTLPDDRSAAHAVPGSSHPCARFPQREQ